MADLRLGDDIPTGGEPISIDQAVTLLLRRLAPFHKGTSQAMAETNTVPPSGDPGRPAPMPLTQRAQMARKIIESMPEEYRTKEVLEQGDIRPFLHQHAGFGEDLADTTEDENGMTARDRALAGAFLMTISIDGTTKLKEQYMAAGMSEEEALVQSEGWKREYLDGIVRRVPIITGTITGVTEDGQVMLSSDASQDLKDSAWEFDPTTVGGADAGPRYMSQEDVVRLLQQDVTGYSGVQEWMASEQGLESQAREAGVDVAGRPVQVAFDEREASKRTYGLAPGLNGQASNQGGRSATVDVQKTYGLSEIARMPMKMSRQEVLTITKKLEKAGYFDLIGSKPVQEGNPHDPTFKKAWQTLMGQSIETKTPMMQLLDERMTAYQEQIDERLITRLTDPARIRINTDAVSQSMLGRKLRPDEHARMVEFVHDLERRNAKLEAGMDPDADEPDAEGTMADVDARLEEMMRGEFDTEASAKEVSDQYGVFSKLLAGPGRGI